MKGVSFGSTHSYRDWGLILTDAEIGLPEVKTSTIDIPGADGVLDLTEALDGTVHYGNRELKLTFVTTEKLCRKDWAALLSDLSTAIHGQRKSIRFDDDTAWVYQGRCYVDAFETSRWTRTVVIRCDCDPYKVGVSDSTKRSL